MLNFSAPERSPTAVDDLLFMVIFGEKFTWIPPVAADAERSTLREEVAGITGIIGALSCPLGLIGLMRLWME